MAAFVVKARVGDARAKTLVFTAMKTMYGGKAIAVADTVYVFDSETSGGGGLIARGVVTMAEPCDPPPRSGGGGPRSGGGGKPPRSTPRVSIAVRITAHAKRALGRAELKPFRGSDGPGAELDFKFYRQATDKIGGITDAAAKWLERRF